MAGLKPRLSGTGSACMSARRRFYSGPEFGNSSGHERIKAVRHRNSVFHDVLKLVPWSGFRQAGRGARRRRGDAQLHLAPAPERAFVCAIERRLLAARDRGGDGEPSGPALSFAARSRRSARPSPTPTAPGISASFPACSRRCWLRRAVASAARWPTRCG